MQQRIILHATYNNLRTTTANGKTTNKLEVEKKEKIKLKLVAKRCVNCMTS